MSDKEKTKMRQEAEEVWDQRTKRTDKPLSEADQLRNIQELQIHQIELEMQAEELRREIEERKRVEGALGETTRQLKLINDVAIGNETKSIEREQEIDDLLVELGRKPKYNS